MKPNQIIIIGGGYSVKEGIEKGLWNKLDNSFTIGLNYSYRFYHSTLLGFIDERFYNGGSNRPIKKIGEKENPQFKDLELIIGAWHNKIQPLSNTILLKPSSKYNRNLEEGVYLLWLAGVFFTSLAIHLLDEGELFLLGIDEGITNFINGYYFTHWYQKEGVKQEPQTINQQLQSNEVINKEGIGRIGCYNNQQRKLWNVFKEESKVKIYNVSEKSNLEVFPKISYGTFFSMLTTENMSQKEFREYTFKKLLELPNEIIKLGKTIDK